MKAKTVYEDITSLEYECKMIGMNYSILFIGSEVDFRWKNVYKIPLGVVDVCWGKIIGDSDE